MDKIIKHLVPAVIVIAFVVGVFWLVSGSKGPSDEQVGQDSISNISEKAAEQTINNQAKNEDVNYRAHTVPAVGDRNKWQTYVNEEFGYSFIYPGDAELTYYDSGKYLYDPTKKSQGASVAVEGSSVGGLRFGIAINPLDAGFCEGSEGGTPDRTIGTYKFTGCKNGNFSSEYSLHNEIGNNKYWLMIDYLPERKADVEKIVESLKFKNQ